MYGIKRELKVNNKENSLLCGSAGYARFVYNYGLNLIIQSWSLEGVKAGDSKRIDAIKKIFTNVTKKQTEYQWTNRYSSRIYQNAFKNLKAAFSRWRNQKLKAGMPKFKRKRHECSFTVDSSNGKVLVQAGKKLKIPTLGTFRLKEAIPYNCVSQTFTISREGNKWFVSFSVDACPIPEMRHSRQKVGIDLGVKKLLVLSDETIVEAPTSIKIAKTKLEKLMWRNRNKVLGNSRQGIKSSQNAKKYFKRLRKQHRYIANVREDFLQKETTRLGKKYQEIAIEDLNVAGMLANRRLSSAISLLGFYRFRELLNYKQEFHGFLLTIVDRWFPSSKTCSGCGHVQEITLKERVFNCSKCGLSIDRDWNASINLENWKSG